ncbi:sulfotransferase 6B1-like [Brachyhypopomus gauderio]|uniref:sulfotransferase 6B1-like n=1 Tax=Brachyhypopomus gauderio TaxID=698409 RepID=UPI0040418C5A
MSVIPNRVKAMMDKSQSMSEDEKLYRYKGVLFPVLISPEENIVALECVEAKDNDVVLVAYPKCGFNWMLAVLRKIIAPLSTDKSELTLPPLLEFFGPELLQTLPRVPPPRLLGTHLHPDIMPPSFFNRKTKMLVVFRNPKDTAVSYYHFSNGNPVLASAKSWDQFCADFTDGDVPWGSYFDHALAWEKHIEDPSVMIITYEELKEDLGGSIKKVAEFFGYELADARIDAIAEDSTFSAMKKGSSDSHGKMANVIFRKGEIGDWRNHFSKAQSEQMDAAFEKHLAGTKLGARLKYDVYCQW